MLWNQRTLTEHLAFNHAKLSIILWGILYALYPPQVIVIKLGYNLILAGALMAILGGLIGLAGLYFSNSNEIERRYKGLIFEAGGLTIAMTGPLSFFFTSAYLTVTLDEPQLHTITAVSYALCASLLSRIVVVRRGFQGRV